VADHTTDPELSCSSLATQTAASSGPGAAAAPIPAGAKVGRYLVIEEIGKGGMGVVYKAYDPELDRKVALKVMTLVPHEGESLSEPRARLLREAQALAQLAHPNVVSVFDVGPYQDSVFVAMELLEGTTLKVWLNQDARPAREKILEVFLAAGRGLAAAHQAGLVHRDFKPENVIQGTDGRVRVVDFGLAKSAERHSDASLDAPLSQSRADESHSTERYLTTPLTRVGSLMGTPQYMAPEQLLRLETDARTDQFSFCVSLFEALFLCRPFPGRTLRELTRSVSQGMIAIPPDHGVPEWLVKVLVRGMEVVPASRYPSMEDLLDALGRDPDRERARRQAERRKMLRFVGAGGLLAAVPLGIWLSLSGRSNPCSGAAERLNGIWDPQVQRTVAQAFTATRQVFAVETWTRVKLRLDGYAREWIALHDEACLATRVRKERSETLLDLQMACFNRRLFELQALTRELSRADALAVERSIQAASALSPVAGCADTVLLSSRVKPPPDGPSRVQAEQLRAELADAKVLDQTGAQQRSLELTSRAVARARALGYAPLLAEALYWNGRSLDELGRYDEAEKVFLEGARRADESEHDALRADLSLQLASLLIYRNARYDEALRLLQYSAGLIVRLGNHAELAADYKETEANIFRRQGKFDEAQRIGVEALALRQKAQGPEHPKTLSTAAQLGFALWRKGDFASAAGIMKQNLAICERVFGPKHPRTTTALNNLGIMYWEQGELDLAEPLLTRSLALNLERRGPNHIDVAGSYCNLGLLFLKQGRYEKAREYLERDRQITTTLYGPSHPDLGDTLHSLAMVYLEEGRLDEAQKLQEQALAIKRKALGERHSYTGDSINELGRIAFAQKRYPQALAHHQKALEIWSEVHGPDNVFPARALLGLGKTYRQLNQPARALEALERSRAILGKSTGDPADLREASFTLAQVLWESGQNRERGRKLALEVRQALARARYGHRELSRVQSWLDQQGISFSFESQEGRGSVDRP